MSLLTRWPKQQLCLDPSRRQYAVQAVEQAFAPTLESLRMDIGLVEMFEAIYVPLAAWLARRKEQQTGPLVVGINGAQGAGKSTLFNLLEVILGDGFDLKVVGLSLDSLYKTHQDRQQLSQQVHPLLMTRGVPGTHDVELGIELLQSLVNSDESTITRIPVFDKSTDDRCSEDVWEEWIGPADIIVFEGWCVGAQPQSEKELLDPVNSLEMEEDPDAAWRRYVNEQLKGPYQQLFEMLDVLLMLKVPSMDVVFEWRSAQEKKLAERIRYIYDTQQPTDLRIMGEDEIVRFIQHYERLTRQMLDDLPERATITLHLNNNHKICDITVNDPITDPVGPLAELKSAVMS